MTARFSRNQRNTRGHRPRLQWIRHSAGAIDKVSEDSGDHQDDDDDGGYK
jgi:hypothetical protein